MKQPPTASHFRRNAAARNLRIVCSFNGAFRRRPPSNSLKYVGGETRIVSVDRNIGFSKLRLRICDLSPRLSSFTLRYRLSVRDGDGESDTCAPLVPVSSDGDVRRMIEEYEKMELSGKRIRLWIYVCRGDNGFESSADSVESCGANRSIVSSENSDQFGGFVRVKKDRKVRCSDDSLRKSVLQQKLSAKQLEAGDYLQDGSRGSEIELRRNCEDYQQKSDQHGEGQYQGNMLVYKTQAAGINGSCLHPLNPMDGNSNYLHNSELKSSIGVHGSKQESEKIGRQSEMSLNRENIIPWIVDFPYRTQCSVITIPVTFQIPGQNANNCNLRAHPYYVRNHKSKPAEMANSQTPTLNGMLSPVIFHPSVEPPSDISKQAKLDCTNSRIFTDIASGGRKRSGDSLFENSEHKEYYGLTCDNANAALDDHSFLSCTTVENSSPVEDLLTGTPYEFYENPNQSSCSINIIPDLSSNPYYMYGQESADRIPTNGIHCWDSGVASSVYLMDNLSLSATNKESPTPSSLTSNDVSFSLVNPETRESGILDGELVTIPKVDKAVQWNSYSCNPATKQNVEVKQQDIQQNQTDKDDTKQDIKGSKATNDNSTDLVPLYTRHLQTIKHSDLEYIKELGSGTYGTVFYGTWKGSDVAIKNIKPSCFNGGSQHDDRLVEDFWKEAKILGKLHHPNIVAFYGVVIDGPANSLATVTEYMVNGSLKQVLQLKDRSIDRRKRVRLAMDAAFGMEYLHDKKIVHFDLKSHNLLVNMRDPRRPVCKIGDLGLSKVKHRTLVSGGVRGTIPWMAPELLNSDTKMVTEKVDVFSFGIVMWELLTGEEPYANLRPQELIGGIIKGSMRPEIPSWCDPGWRSLMERCWASDPESRPSFSEIAKELRTMGAALNIQ